MGADRFGNAGDGGARLLAGVRGPRAQAPTRKAARPRTPLVFASPHSGRLYPPDMMAAARLTAQDLRGSEDAFVDDLIGGAPALGGGGDPRPAGPGLYRPQPRAPGNWTRRCSRTPCPTSPRPARPGWRPGWAAIARVAGEGRPIYARKLTFAEAKARIETAHRPYHDALDRLLAQARNAHGLAILVDWHSMPAAAARGHRARGGGPCDIVLGDRFGAACGPKLTGLMEKTLEGLGYRVARNAPYAGGYTTEHYGRPARRTHAIQVEINRALYMNETTREPTEGLARLKADIDSVTAGLVATDWAELL